MKQKILRKLLVVTPLFIIVLAFMSTCRLNNSKRACKLRFGVLFTEELEKGPLDGRMLLMISNDESREPRFQISSRSPNAQLIFGIDVDGVLPGDIAIFDANVFGFPLKSISEIPAGEYSVQALLHKYETFHRADGHVVKLPMDRGEGQRWNQAHGDAITYELIPYIEKKFRGIGEGWARTLYGGSTGGWESLAVQIFYPDEYNGTWTFCPDPIDFRAYVLVDIYEHSNAYYVDSQWKRTPIPGFRSYLGEVLATNEEANHLELVIGTNSRSGGQYDIWQAVFGPVGEDGYPKPIWDKRTGKIDHSVAEYWRENYDLRYILERDWKTLGPKLKGKIHIYTGDMDNWYLNNAVYLMEEFLKSTKAPYYDGTVKYGDRHPHCWCGDYENPLSISMLTVNQRFAPIMVKHILKAAPPGADTISWRY